MKASFDRICCEMRRIESVCLICIVYIEKAGDVLEVLVDCKAYRGGNAEFRNIMRRSE